MTNAPPLPAEALARRLTELVVKFQEEHPLHKSGSPFFILCDLENLEQFAEAVAAPAQEQEA